MGKDYSGYIHNNKEVPRVSEIIKLLGKDALILWANHLGFKRKSYKDVLQAEANIGTMIHEFIDEMDDLKSIEGFDFSKYRIFNEGDKNKVINGILSFKKFYNKNRNKFKVVSHDITLTNSQMGGTLDVVLESPFNKEHVVIADYKTSSDFYFTHFLQLAGYVILHRDNFPNVIIDGVMIILIDKADGKKARTKFYDMKQMEPFFNIFIQLLEVHKNIKLIDGLQYYTDVFE